MNLPPVGTTVQWMSHPNDINAACCAAIVTAVNINSVDLWIVPPGYLNGMTRNTVPHRRDKNINMNSIQDTGCWQEVPKMETEAKAEPKAEVKK